MPPVIADALKLEQAFALVSPRRVAQALRQSLSWVQRRNRHTAYAAREAIREAVARQDPTWQAEFWQQSLPRACRRVRRYDVPLCQ